MSDTETTAVTKSEPQSDPAATMRGIIQRSMKSLAMAMPRHVSAERIARVAMTEITRIPDLALCTPASFMACLLTAAQLGLEPGGPLGHGWLIPRWNTRRGVHECTWQTGYQGFIDLAFRSGMVSGIDADVVRAGDHFEWCKGLHPKLDHRPAIDPQRNQKPILYAYAVVRIKGSDHPHFEVLDFAEIERRRGMNDAERKGKFSPWKDHYAAMAKKTAIREAIKYAPKSAEVQRLEGLEAAGERGLPMLPVIDDALAAKLIAEGIATKDDTEPQPEVREQDQPQNDSPAAAPAENVKERTKRRREELDAEKG